MLIWRGLTFFYMCNGKLWASELIPLVLFYLKQCNKMNDFSITIQPLFTKPF